MSKSLKRTLVAAGMVAAVGLGGAAAVQAGGDDDEGGGVPRAEAAAATAAALKITGGGTANAVERDGENGATFEVEVTKPGGATVDVRLDEGYRLVVVESDSETE